MRRPAETYAWDDIRNATGNGELHSEAFSTYSNFDRPSSGLHQRQRQRRRRPLSHLLLPLALAASLCSFALVELAKVFRG